MQEMTNQLGTGVIEAMYLKPPPIDLEGFLAVVQLYYSDLSLFEPNLIAAYDSLLTQLDAAPPE